MAACFRVGAGFYKCGLHGITSIHGEPLTFMLMMGYSEQRIDEWGE